MLAFFPNILHMQFDFISILIISLVYILVVMVANENVSNYYYFINLKKLNKIKPSKSIKTDIHKLKCDIVHRLVTLDHYIKSVC